MISVLLLACELAHVGALARIEARARAATSRDTRLLDRFALRRFFRVTRGCAGYAIPQSGIEHLGYFSRSELGFSSDTCEMHR